MKRYLFSGLVFILISTISLWAQTKLPHITFKTFSHDFGQIKEGDSVSCEFTFTNTGNAPLIITSITTSCGCTVSQWPKKPILPGQSAKIKATYHSKGRPGAFSKSLAVHSNDPKDEPFYLALRGEAFKHLKEK